MEKKIKHFYHGKVFYDTETFMEHVKNFPNFPLNKNDFDWLFEVLAHNIWINLEMRDCIPNGKDWNEWLDKVFVDTLNKFFEEDK